MQKILSFQWPCQVDWKTTSEDVFFVDKIRRIFVVADGVTRRGFTGPYPDPSPARLAAAAVVEALGKTPPDQFTQVQQVHEAFKQANRSVRSVNEHLGLWAVHDWWGHDLAGAVAAYLAIQEKQFFYGFIADCGIAQIASSGNVLWHTPDLLAPAQKHFPATDTLGIKERFMRVRRDFRNKPQANLPTYGVLTGEEAALAYIKTGIRPYRKGDVLAVYSDGAVPFVVKDQPFQHLLCRGLESEIAAYVAQRSSPEQHSDEKTLIVVRT